VVDVPFSDMVKQPTMCDKGCRNRLGLGLFLWSTSRRLFGQLVDERLVDINSGLWVTNSAAV